MLPIRTVLCPVDFSPASERARLLGLELCRRLDARLILAHNLDDHPPGLLSVSWMWSEEHEGDARDHARRAEQSLRRMVTEAAHSVPTEGKLTYGPLDEGLPLLAEEVDADLILMGTRGHGDAEHHSIAEGLILRAPCPVLALRHDSAGDPLRPGATLLVPVDFARPSLDAAEWAFDLAEHLPVDVHLVHVEAAPEETLPWEERRQHLRARLAELVPEDLAGRARCHALRGHPTEAIPELATELGADLVVMGARRKGLWRSFLFGATCREALEHCCCPVLFVPANRAARRRRNRIKETLSHGLEAGQAQYPGALAGHP